MLQCLGMQPTCPRNSELVNHKCGNDRFEKEHCRRMLNVVGNINRCSIYISSDVVNVAVIKTLVNVIVTHITSYVVMHLLVLVN